MEIRINGSFKMDDILNPDDSEYITDLVRNAVTYAVKETVANTVDQIIREGVAKDPELRGIVKNAIKAAIDKTREDLKGE